MHAGHFFPNVTVSFPSIRHTVCSCLCLQKLPDVEQRLSLWGGIVAPVRHSSEVTTTKIFVLALHWYFWPHRQSPELPYPGSPSSHECPRGRPLLLSALHCQMKQLH